jgi:hypothetical protein
MMKACDTVSSRNLLLPDEYQHDIQRIPWRYP